MTDPVILIAVGHALPGMGGQLAAWHARQALVLSQQEGFISTDVLPPRAEEQQGTWRIVITFRSEDTLENWRRSNERQALLSQAGPWLVEGTFQESVHSDATTPGDQDPRIRTDVTEVIFSKVKSGMTDRFRDWALRIQVAQAHYPGYLGMYLQPPAPGVDGHWTSIVRYDSAAHLEGWMNSEERAVLLRESKEFMESEELMRLSTAFPGWVPIDPLSGQGPPNWKTAMLVLLGLYPIVMLELRLLSPLLGLLGIQGAPATFLGNSISVGLTSYLTMPFFVRKFEWWLFPSAQSVRALSRRGTRMIGLLYVMEILFFWKVLPP
jgi:antibiotic biosynthesis monooxygenase (ABM) superfamily enzyme